MDAKKPISHTNKHVISYRSDIDGLRAIAVLSVVLFHIDASLMPGGFIGVDIFFVISGFLITSIITKGAEAGNFSLKEFYRRRIKRIVPVLTFVILATLLAGHFILLPEDLSRLSWSAISSQLFFANIYFTYFLDTSYFADDASLEPLLHLWSLGVEEQFYLFWPLVLTMGLLKLRLKTMLPLLLALAFASFVLGEAMLADKPMFAYYMLPTRAGELFTGGICFFLTRTSLLAGLSRTGNEVLAWLGMALIAGSLILLGEGHGFPGFNAVPVTVGTAFLIFSGSRGPTALGQFLSLRPVVGIGLVSYSMYLWHWPVLAFLKYAYADLTSLQKAMSFVMILALSILSYHLVEQRFKADRREFSIVFKRQLLIPSSAIIFICALIIGSGGLGLYYFNDGYKTRLAGFSEEEKSAHSFPYVCQSPFLSAGTLASTNCIIGSSSEPGILLWGDSNASHYIGVIGELAEEFGFSFRNAAHSSCPPLLFEPQRFVSARVENNCIRSNAEVLKRLDSYDTLILSAAWDTYLSRDKEVFSAALESTISDLVAGGKQVIVLGRVPRIGTIDRKCSKKSLKLKTLDCGNSARGERRNVDRTNTNIRSIANAAGASYYDIIDILCDSGNCSGILDGQFVYFDKGHLSMNGSIKVGNQARGVKSASLVFEHLPTTPIENRTPLPWMHDPAVSDRNPAMRSKVLIMGSDKFLDRENWTGENTRQGADDQSLVFSDQSSGSYEQSEFNFERGLYPTPGPKGRDGKLLFEITIQRQNKGFPMFRFRDSVTRQGFDIIVDDDKARLLKRGKAGMVVANIQDRDTWLDITIEIPVSVLPNQLSLIVYPAASDTGAKYSRENTGRISISSIEAFLVSG